MNHIRITGALPPRFAEGLSLLREELRLEETAGGFPVVLERAERFCLVMDREKAVLRWSKTAEVYRGLSLLDQHWGTEQTFDQGADFETAGIMFDVSRNAVLQPHSIRFFLRKMACLGLNLAMMYTEDTYQVDEYPYFGYLRGKYSKDDIRALDDYADALGIELVPCIQTLAHLNRALHWPAMAHMKDTEEVLLVDDEAALDFIRAMLKNATEPYRTNRIHIGMDEAHFLGLGGYLRKHGYTDPFTIMERHLENVGKIVRELGLDAMMWSDMYFRLASPTGGYYDAPDLPASVVEKAPADIRLVYWDYYQSDSAVYERMMTMHERFKAPTAFACGLWTWAGPAPHYVRFTETALVGLKKAKEHRIPLVFATAWGDNGAECPLLAAVYSMTVYAEHCYGEPKEGWCDDRFRAVMGAEPAPFKALSRFHQLPGIPEWSLRPNNACKYLLYQDPIVPLYDKDLEGVDLESHYAALEQELAQYTWDNYPYNTLFAFYTQLARTLKLKGAFHMRAGKTVRAGDREQAYRCVRLAMDAHETALRLRVIWRELWEEQNKLYGYEIIDVRLGGVIARLDTAQKLMLEFAQGKRETIAPLAEEPLPYTLLPDGSLRGSYAWGEIVSPCKADL